MKVLLAVISLVFATQVASAVCYKEVDQRLRLKLESLGHDYYGIKQYFGKDVINLVKYASFPEENISLIGKLLQTGNYEFFELTASQGPGGYQELLVVNKASCRTYRKFILFEE